MANERAELLMSFLESGSSLDHEELAIVVSDMCVNDHAPLTTTEAAIAYDILTRLYPDAEFHVRRKLSELFALREDVPHSLIVMLANDQIDIARQVIMHSPLLDDEDLLKLIVDRPRDHRLAVSIRQPLSTKVSDALVYLDDHEVMANLVRNHQAGFSEHAFKRMVMASRSATDLQDPLLRRAEMRADLAAMMYQWVGQALRHFIAQNYGEALSMALDEEVGKATEGALQEHHAKSGKSGSNSATTVVAAAPPAPPKQPAGSTILNTMLVALRRNHLESVEEELQDASRLSKESTSRILYNDNGEGLAVVCKALGVSRAVYSEIFTRLHGTQPYSRFTTSDQHIAALQAFERLSSRQATGILDHWRKSPNDVWGDPKRCNVAWEMRQRKLKEQTE